MNHSSQNSRATKVRAVIATLVTCALLGVQASHVAAVDSLTGKEFGYWDGSNVLAENADHVSLVMLSAADHQFWTKLSGLPPTIKAIVSVSNILTQGNPCALDQYWQINWASFVSVLTPWMGRIAAFDVAHEPDTTGRNCFPGDADPRTKMAQLLDQLSLAVKNTPGWPPVKTYITYGPSAELVTGPLAQHIDWNGFDCYGPFENCWAQGLSIPQVVDAMATRLNPSQSIFLISDASTFLYDGSSRRMHESELFIRGIEYWQTAMTHPRVKGMLAFIWGGPHFATMPPVDTMYDIRDSPGLTTLYRAIGLNVLTGAVPTVPPFNVPVDCVITAGTTCNVNLSWANVNGSNLHLFARLVSNFDVGGGAFCPGATSCSIPLGPGDYIFELRETSNIGSKLIYAKRTEVRYPAAPTGQIATTPSACVQYSLPGGGITCPAMFTANVQNAPNASFFLSGGGELCGGLNRTSLCNLEAAQLPLGGPYTFTVLLRVNRADPNSQILDQRTFSMSVLPQQ